MKVFHDRDDQIRMSVGGRTLPYEADERDLRMAYYDFKANPELIPAVLEDYLPHGHHAGVQRFYGFLRAVNGPGLCLETTDCGLHGFGPNQSPELGNGAASQIFGRVMLIYRDHSRNTSRRQISELRDEVVSELEGVDPDWPMAAIGYAFYNAHFSSICPEPTSESIGQELTLRLWVWGNDEIECFDNFGRLSANLETAICRASITLRDKR